MLVWFDLKRGHRRISGVMHLVVHYDIAIVAYDVYGSQFSYGYNVRATYS